MSRTIVPSAPGTDRPMQWSRWQAWAAAVVVALVLSSALVLVIGLVFKGGVSRADLMMWLVLMSIFTATGLVYVEIWFLRASGRRLDLQLRLQDMIFETTPLGVLTLAPDLHVARINPVARQWFGADDARLASSSLTGFTHPEDRGEVEAALQQLLAGTGRLILANKRLLMADGGVRWVDLALSALHGAHATSDSILVILTDVSQRVTSEQAIHQLAYFDALTGLPNRRLMIDRLSRALHSSQRNARWGAVMFVDLDNFKTVNDTLGHDVGDRLLKQVTRQLGSCIRAGDTLCRQGGDEFVVILENLNESHEAAGVDVQAVGAKMLLALQEIELVEEPGYQTSASIGVCLFRGQGVGEDEILKRADIAMYQSKAAGRNALRFFEPDMQRAVTERARLDADLRQALRRGEFFCLFQLQTGEGGAVTGAELLLRWQHPHHGTLQPERFISLAEHNGVIVPLGHWVLEFACAQLRAWGQDPGTAHLTLAVNVSARQFHQHDFAERILELVERYQIPPGKLKLELTESLVLKDIDVSIARMRTLRDRGLAFALDDFGTGYSSLAYLAQLPLDQLKIDQSFVHSLGRSRGSAVIVKTIIDLAHNLGLEVIAEGVETAPQQELLAARGCHSYQGYLVSPPVPPAELAQELALLARRAESATGLAC